MADVRIELRDMVQKAQLIHQNERTITLESVDIVGAFERRNAAVNLGMTSERFARHVGLTPSVYWKRAQVARVMRRFPKARELLDSGVTRLSQLSMAAGKITDANSELILDGLKDRSKREVEVFLSRVTPDGRLQEAEGAVELRIRLTETQLKMLDRAREVLAAGGKVPALPEIFLAAMGDLLARRDPLARAERAAKRQAVQASKPARDLGPAASSPAKGAEPAPRGAAVQMLTPEAPTSDRASPGKRGGHLTKSVVAVQAMMPEAPTSDRASPGKRGDRRIKVPAAIQHAVRLRDQGQCTWVFPDGNRCPERMMIELDHLEMICRSGENSVENVVERCRRHNLHRAQQDLGMAFMARWTDTLASDGNAMPHS